MASVMNNVQISAMEVMRDLECLICMEVPSKPPIYQCEEGHILCEVCYEGRKQKENNCPACKVPLTGIRCRMAEKMISKLPTKCKYSNEGCDVELMSDELKKHEDICKFKPIACLDLQCKEEIKAMEFAKHMEEHEIDDQEPHEAAIAIPDKYKSAKTNMQCPLIHFRVKEEDFYLVMVRLRKGMWHLWVTTISTDVGEKFSYQLEMKKEDLKQKYQYSGVCSSLDKDSVKQMMSDKFSDGLILYDSILEKFLTSDQCLYLKIKISNETDAMEETDSMDTCNEEPVQESKDVESQNKLEALKLVNEKDEHQITSKTNQPEVKKSRDKLKQKKSFLSNDLASIVGRNRATQKFVMKQMWAYIRKHDLQDPSNKQVANCDDKLRRVIGKKKLKCIYMKKYLNAHMGNNYQHKSGIAVTMDESSKEKFSETAQIKIRSNKDLFDGNDHHAIGSDNVQANIYPLSKSLWWESDELAIIEEIRQLCEEEEDLERNVS